MPRDIWHVMSQPSVQPKRREKTSYVEYVEALRESALVAQHRSLSRPWIVLVLEAFHTRDFSGRDTIILS